MSRHDINKIQNPTKENTRRVRLTQFVTALRKLPCTYFVSRAFVLQVLSVPSKRWAHFRNRIWQISAPYVRDSALLQETEYGLSMTHWTPGEWHQLLGRSLLSYNQQRPQNNCKLMKNAYQMLAYYHCHLITGIPERQTAKSCFTKIFLSSNRVIP